MGDRDAIYDKEKRMIVVAGHPRQQILVGEIPKVRILKKT
jgi:hypothetical protein